MRTITTQLCLLGMIASVCACASVNEDPFASLTMDSDWTAADDGTETDGTDPMGDGDGDPTGDGDGDPTGDGDGDPTGDGDGDPTGDGDTTDGCTQLDGSEAELSAKHNRGLYLSYGGPVGDIGECDIFTQDCAAGEKCVPYASQGATWDSNKCVAVTGDGGAGESCISGGIIDATDDCDASTVCWDTNAQNVGTCTPFCKEGPSCPEGTSCSLTNQGAVALCLAGCDPLLQNCAGDQACYYDGGGFTCAPTAGDIPPGQPCGFINDCAEGSLCLNGEVVPNCAGISCCGQFCDLDCAADSCTLPGTSCVPFYEANMAPPGLEDIGVCAAQ